MHIICNKSELSQAVAKVSGAVAAKSTIPALEGILLKTTETGLYIAGYDLSLGITTHIPALVKKEGAVILAAKRLNEMIIKLSGEKVDISVNEKLLCTLTSDFAEYTMLGTNDDEFPELPDTYIEENIVLEQKVLKRSLNQTVFAISSNEARPVHMGAKFDFKGKILNVVAIDGARLALSRHRLVEEKETGFVVPKKTLQELIKILNDEEGNVEIKLSNKHVVFELNNFTVISRIIEGEFLDYNPPIEGVLNNYKTAVVVNRRKFTESFDRAAVIITEKIKSPIRMSVEEGNINIECVTSVGKIKDDIEAKVNGEEVKIGFNNQYIIDALRNCDDDEIKLYFSGSLSPMLIMPKEGDDYIFMIMPMRLQ